MSSVSNILKSTCCACLSTDRRLVLIHDLEFGLENFFLLLSFENECKVTKFLNVEKGMLRLFAHIERMDDEILSKEYLLMNSADLYVCWECKAVINRFTKFRHQVAVAQGRLTSMIDSCGQETKMPSTLSCLKEYHLSAYELTLANPHDDHSLEDNFVDCGGSPEMGEVGSPLAEICRRGIENDKRTGLYLQETEVKRKPKTNNENPSQYLVTKEVMIDITQLTKSDSSVKDENEERGDEEEKIDGNEQSTQKLSTRNTAKIKECISKEIRPPAVEHKDYYTTRIMSEEDMLANRNQRRLSDSSYLASPIKCESCILGFRNKKELDEHALSVHTKKRRHAQCSVCRAYVKSSAFMRHVASHYHSYSCNLCQCITFDYEASLTHLRTIHAVDNVRLRRERPAIKNPGSKPRKWKPAMDKPTALGFKCFNCEKYFHNKANRWKHVQRMHMESFPCATCGKKFAFRDTLKKHEILHQGPLPRQECETCHKQIRTDLMKVHLRTHTDRERYHCHVCAKSYVSLTSYNHHLRFTKAHSTVDDKYKYVCSMCKKGYVSQGELRDHINYQHKGITLHKCPICNKALATRRCVTRHVKRVHSGIKDQPKDKICGQCGKAFRERKCLREHELIHTGERPLSCEICGVTFRQSASLYTHKKRVHSVYPPQKALAVAVVGTH